MGNYNYIIDHTLTEVGYTEPVSVTEAKLYCRVTHTSEDTLIGELITTAREAIETATRLSLISKTVDIWFTNEAGDIPIPFGPYQSGFVLLDSDGNAIAAADYKLVGGKHPFLSYPLLRDMKATYTAGFTVVPKQLQTAILDQVNHLYENRGANDQAHLGVCMKAWRACQQFTRTSPVI